MADDESFVCMFCGSDITASQETTTVPNLGVLVHTECYQRERGDQAEESAA